MNTLNRHPIQIVEPPPEAIQNSKFSTIQVVINIVESPSESPSSIAVELACLSATIDCNNSVLVLTCNT